MAKIVVTGDKKLDKALKRLGSKVANKIATQAMRNRMKPVAAKVKEKAPKATGALASAVKLRVATRAPKKGIKSYHVFISAKLLPKQKRYAAAEELGSKHPDKKAVKFMREAYQSEAERVKNGVMKDIAQGIEREASKG